jgi:type I restriction enzyme M protein
LLSNPQPKNKIMGTNNTKEQILEDNQVMCILTEKPRKATSQENNLQSIIRMLNEEYGFDLNDMERDFNIIYTDPDTGKIKTKRLNSLFLKKDNHTIKIVLLELLSCRMKR